MATHYSVLFWRTHGQWSLVGYSPWGGKESDMTLQACIHLPLECYSLVLKFLLK